MDPDFAPPQTERREVFGVTMEQRRNDVILDESILKNAVTRNREFPPEARRDLLVATIALKFTQSNSVCFALDGQVVGNGAGQQSRVHCAKLADPGGRVAYEAPPQVPRPPFQAGRQASRTRKRRPEVR